MTSFVCSDFRQREIDVRIGNARPVELGEQIGLARIGVRQAHGVTAAAMKRLAEMQNLGAAFAPARRHVLAHLPIHRGLERVLDRERAAFDEEIAFERRQTGHPRECFDKFRVAFGINIRVRDLDLRGAQEIGLHLGALEMRMIESDRIRAKEAVEIDQALVVDRVVQIGAAAFLEIDHDLEAIEQDVLLETFQDAGCVVIFILRLWLALADAAPR